MVKRFADEIGSDKPVNGFVFYHAQDVTRVIETHNMYLCFGSSDGASNTMKNVGRKLVAVLTEEGFSPIWSGDIDERIVIPDFDWKRRWPNHHQDAVKDYKALAVQDL